MKRFWVEGWLHHADERFYPRQYGFYFYAKNRKEATKIIKRINWIWWQAEDLSESQRLAEELLG